MLHGCIKNDNGGTCFTSTHDIFEIRKIEKLTTLLVGRFQCVLYLKNPSKSWASWDLD